MFRHEKYTPFGYQVKKKLLDKNMSIIKMEKELNIPKNYVSLIIRGYRPGSQYVEVIAKFLDIDMTSMLYPTAYTPLCIRPEVKP